MENIESAKDEELLAIIRLAENTNVAGSRYQRAVKELELRDREKILNKPPQSGIFLRVGGDMKHDGAINADTGSIIDIAVAGKYENKKGTINQGVTPVVPMSEGWHKRWWMVYIVYPLIVGIVILGVTILSKNS
jgi:hypothetical protein